MFVHPLPVDLPELRALIINAFQEINRGMLSHMWDELYYKFVICRITRGEYMEHL